MFNTLSKLKEEHKNETYSNYNFYNKRIRFTGFTHFLFFEEIIINHHFLAEQTSFFLDSLINFIKVFYENKRSI